MAGQVLFKVDADLGKAIDGFLKLVDSQKKVEKGFSRAMGMGKRMDRNLKKMTRTVSSVVGGFLGARGLKMAFTGVVESMSKARKEVVSFENEITGLLSLGGNIDNIDKIKNDVLSLSGAFGTARANIAATLFDLQSGSAGLSKGIQEEVLKNTLELVKVTGTDMPVAMKALLKSYRIFGSETKSVNDIQNILFTTAERGFLQFRDLAVFLPDLASAAKTFGFSLEEVGASVIVATGKLGRTRKTLTSLRNVFLSMTAAEKMGVKMTDDLVENFRRLSMMDPDFFIKAFGKGTVGAIGALVDNTEALDRELINLKNLQGDITAEKLHARLKDQAFLFTEITKSVKEMNKNLVLSKDYIKDFGGKDVGYQFTKLGVKSTLPAWAQDIPGLTTALSIINELIPDDTAQRKGRALYKGQLKRTGRTEVIKELDRQFPDRQWNYGSLYKAAGKATLAEAKVQFDNIPIISDVVSGAMAPVGLLKEGWNALFKSNKKIAHNTSRPATLAHGEKPEVK